VTAAADHETSHDGRDRPLSVTLAAWLFIVVGAGGILKDVLPLLGPDRADAFRGLTGEGPLGLTLIWGIRLLAVVGGAFVLRGQNWARWLLVAWMVLHVGISLLHSPPEAAMHVVIFAGLTFLLFRPPASRYFAVR
jgi:hypothetical protein